MFWLEKVLLRTVSRNLFADFPAQQTLIQESGLNWTIVRPARLTNGPKTGVYPSGERIFIHPFTSISRADVADYMIKAADDSSLIGRVVGVSN